MRKLAFLFVAFALVAVSFYGCDETNPTEPAGVVAQNPTAPSFDAVKKPVSPDAFETVITEMDIAAGQSRWNHAICPLGTFPMGCSYRIYLLNPQRDDYENVEVFHYGVQHLYWEAEAPFSCYANVQNNRPAGDEAVRLWLRAYCFEAGFLHGNTPKPE